MKRLAMLAGFLGMLAPAAFAAPVQDNMAAGAAPSAQQAEGGMDMAGQHMPPPPHGHHNHHCPSPSADHSKPDCVPPPLPPGGDKAPDADRPHGPLPPPTAGGDLGNSGGRGN